LVFIIISSIWALKPLFSINQSASFQKHDKKLREEINRIEQEMTSPIIERQCNHPQQRALLESMKNHWQGLTVLVDNPDVDMDNNIREC